MNKTFKILLLIIAISVSIGGILFYYKTIVSPPENLEFTNKHIEDITKSYNLFVCLNTDDSRDSLFLTMKDKVELCFKENFIDSNERDELMEGVINQYLPLFISSCKSKFNKSIWSENDHRWMERKIKELKSLKLKNDLGNMVQGEYDIAMDTILCIIKDYNTAKKISRLTAYKSLAETKNVISESQFYANKSYLKNCEWLVEQLNNLPHEIEKNHFAFLISEVNSLNGYRQYEEIPYKDLSKKILDKLREYKNNALSVYGYSSDIKELENVAAKYYNDAMAYYESLRKPEINIDYYPEWTTMHSPHNSYSAFKSESNYCIGNSTATMSFTIRGYESFSFEVRSDGESNHDYVMVGIDHMPKPSDNFYSTKGFSNSGTSFYDYKTVFLENLNKEKSYTIYIVYRKDGSVNYGTDRGYILIPHVQN